MTMTKKQIILLAVAAVLTAAFAAFPELRQAVCK